MQPTSTTQKSSVQLARTLYERDAMSSPPTPEKQLEEIFTELEHNLNDPKALLGYGHAIEQVKALLTTQRKKLLDEVEAAGPGDRSNKHELGDFTPDQIEDIEKTAIAAIFEAQGFNQANRLWHAAIKALKEREL